jgi:murein DD-endopeptidase MepM/ murein hydrolase activator NlpD
MKNPVTKFKFQKYPYGDCTQWFGENPSLYASMGLKGHNGIDIVRPWGEHMFAIEAGTVYDVKEDPTGYGKHIRILSPSGDVIHDWVYGHMSYIHVKNGDKVTEGQYIGNIGNTGFVVSNGTGNGFWKANPYAGTHIHLGLRDVVHDKGGFKPEGYSRAIRVLNYNNGFKGRYDPLPLLSTSKALTWARLADKYNSSLYWQASVLLSKLEI